LLEKQKQTNHYAAVVHAENASVVIFDNNNIIMKVFQIKRLFFV